MHREARNALRKSDDDQRQDCPENETPILRERLQLILQKDVAERTDNRTEEVSKATQDGHENELAGLRPVNKVGIGKTDAKAHDGTANGAECRRYDKGRKAKTAHVHAEIFSLKRVIANGPKVQSERRMHEPPHDEAADDQQTETVVVERSGQELDFVVLDEFQPRKSSSAPRACRCRRQ